jgi:hypothetical protein
MITGNSFPEGEVCGGRETDHSLPSRAGVKNDGAISHLHPSTWLHGMVFIWTSPKPLHLKRSLNVPRSDQYFLSQNFVYEVRSAEDVNDDIFLISDEILSQPKRGRKNISLLSDHYLRIRLWYVWMQVQAVTISSLRCGWTEKPQRKHATGNTPG